MDPKSMIVVVAVMALAMIVAAVGAFKLGRMSRKKQDEAKELDQLSERFMRPDPCLYEKSNIDDPVLGVELGELQSQKMAMPARDDKGRFLPTKKAVE